MALMATESRSIPSEEQATVFDLLEAYATANRGCFRRAAFVFGYGEEEALAVFLAHSGECFRSWSRVSRRVDGCMEWLPMGDDPVSNVDPIGSCLTAPVATSTAAVPSRPAEQQAASG
jgi:hypothetical protein